MKKLILYMMAFMTVFSLTHATENKNEAQPTIDYNLNYGWKFKKVTDFPLAKALEAVKSGKSNFYEEKYNDKKWETVSVPHAVNAEDSFDETIVDAGEQSLFRGFMFYRKKVNIPETDAGKKFFLEFEAVRQTVYVWVNGKAAGYYEAGVTAIAFDISKFIIPGKENLIAVATDNAASRGASFQTKETQPGNSWGDQSGSSYEWNTKDFNEVQGGLTGNVILHTRGLIYQTLPLYSNLKTTGNYITAKDFDFSKGTATISVDAEIRNESDSGKNITLEVFVEDSNGEVKAHFKKEENVDVAKDKGVAFLTVVPQDAYAEKTSPVSIETVDVSHIKAEGKAEKIKFWSPEEPYLYTVRTLLKDGDIVLDEERRITGFREIAYDESRGGLLINGKNIYLKGYAQRSTNEWAVIGVAPDWLTDYDMQLVRESNANYIRWMHVSPKPSAIRSGDKYGIVSICPAGDKERDAEGRQWAQRVEVMRDAIIYFRNSPSVWFYEAGNNAVSASHMEEMTKLRKQLDPDGFRLMGCRSISTPEQIAAAEWAGTMIWRHDEKAKDAMKAVGKNIPMLETEFKRDESPRRIFDDFTPPDYDYKNLWLGDGGKKKDHYDVWDQTQEDHILSLPSEEDGYAYFWHNRVGGESGNNYYSGAAMMVWSDSNMHGRNSGTENCRTSGRVDPIRIKKESFYAVQVMQSPLSKIHIVGHWNYPPLTKNNYIYNDKVWDSFYWTESAKKLQRDPLHKTVYVVATPDTAKVELYVNGKFVGKAEDASNIFIFAIPDVDVTQSGTVIAKAYNKDGLVIAEDKKHTAGEAHHIILIPVTGPNGFIADGSDIAFFDVAVVDKDGNLCPTACNRIDFKSSGQGVFLGGYNSGKVGAESVIHKNHVFAECGCNRVFVRASSVAGKFTLTATSKNLGAASVTIESKKLYQDSREKPQQFAINSFEPLVQDKMLVTDVGIKKIKKAKREAYSITVNGKAVSFTQDAYRPDTATGVICEIRPVLESLKEAGVKFSYTYQKEGKLPPYLTSFHLPLLTIENQKGKRIDLVCGETAIIVDSGADKNLTNAEFIVSDSGELIAELEAVLGYLDGVTVKTDDKTHTVDIRY
ncbi:MAG: hypothetical protein K6F69_02505 [Treponema sp.]|nr:hypothetical protein [Treponema sp.]